MEIKSFSKRINWVLTLVLTITALTLEQSAWAQTFTIEESYNASTHKTTFTIKRSGSSLPQQTIYYRTVNLSAYAGQHYTAVNDTYTFPANETTKTVVVTESTPGTDAYQFQTSTDRSYRFEVLDVNGFELQHYDRTYATGTSVPSSGLFNEKAITIYSSEVLYTDAGYNQTANTNHYINSSSYYSLSNIAPKAYYTLIGAQLRSTLSFEAKEKINGYQYVQILINNITDSDNRSTPKCDDGDPGHVNISRYMAGFDHEPSKANTNYAAYTFPVTSQPDNNTNPVDNVWNNGVTNKLYKQKFNTNCRATDGRLILPVDFESFVVRFNASGSDEDDWYAKNVKAHIQAVDATKPTLYNNSTNGITVSGGPYVKGNTFYISVPFSEIVHITGNDKQLETSWGPATYESGDYSNVITFKGTITADAVTTLKITGITNTKFRDLANNSDAFNNNSFNKTFTGVTCTDTYTLVATNTVFTGLNAEYVVSNTTIEPHPTIYFYKGKKETANRVTLTENTNYTLSWTDNSAAGTGTITATGAGSYTGSISTTFPIRWSTYTVRFHSNYDTDATSEQPFTYSTPQVLTANTFSRTGYTYNGWSTTTDGSVVYTDGQEVLNLTAEDEDIVEIYAQWNPNTYTVQFNANDGSGEMSDQDLTYNEAQNLTANVFTRIGYTFKGWNTDADGNGTAYTDRGSVMNLTDKNNDIVTLYAQWTDQWGIYSGATGEEDHPYVISDTTGLNLLATLVNGGNDFDGKYFKLGADITYTNTTDWNDATSTENNFTAIGGYVDGNWRDFRGTFDGQNHTVRGIRIYKDGTTGADDYQGLFGMTSDATIRNVILADARITGRLYVGGIAGYNSKNAGKGGIVENCRVGSDVCIHAVVEYASNHGGVVGDCNGGTISGCVSSATLTVANDLTGISVYGGIVGYLNGDMSDCLAIGASVPAVDYNGAIAGDVFTYSTAINNYYYNCTVGGATTNVGVSGDNENVDPHDRDGARSVHSLTLPLDVTATGESVTIGTDIYYASNTTVTLNAPTGYVISAASYSDGADHNITGNTFTMPASDITVSATLTNVWGIASDKDGSTAEKAYTITTTTGLDLLATLVNGGNNFDGKYFKLDADITYTNTSDWNDATSTENNYTAIGGYVDGNWRYFRGTFDGQNHTVRGIRIYKGGTTNADSYQGLFGMTSGATIRNVILTDAHITGMQNVGGIAGFIVSNGNGGIVENCRVGRDVTIHAVVDDAYHHGGVVGMCDCGNISGCVSSATLTVDNCLTGINTYGGIVGHLDGNMSDCLSIDVSVPAVNRNGAIAGEVASTLTLTNNYYYNCTVGGATTNVGVGSERGNTTPPHDIDGARSVHSLTLPSDVTATGESVTIGTDTYYARYTTVTLNIPTGYVMSSASYYDGTDHDITGNTFTMPAADVTVSATLTNLWDITSDKDGTTAEKAYTITSTAGLDLLATLVNGGNNFDGKYFKLDADITYTNTTDWNDSTSTENNYTAIGGYFDGSWRDFSGTFDGQNHTVSGIRIYKGGTTNADDSQGLFGSTSGATIRNVILADARITGKREVGGIAGYIAEYDETGGIVENCRVGRDVTIHAVVDNASSHGGVVGDYNGTISGCVSSATLTVANDLTSITYYGGIVGFLNGDMSDCLSIDASVPAVDYNGAIAGFVAPNSTQTNNYYYNCTVGGATTNVGIGAEQGNTTPPHDLDGARSVHALTLGTGITATGESVTNGTDIYYASNTTVTLNIPTGYVMSSVSYNDGTDHDITGNTFTMPAADVIVSATLTDLWDITSGKDGTTAEKAYTITSTAGLDLLATLVNGGNDFDGKYFKLGADITYTNTTDWNDATSTENNFTAIGVYVDGNWRYFCGTFDGQNHTVSGIRIYKGGTTGADSFQGLFGMTRGATIRNVILADARITGRQYVGGIAGCITDNAWTGGIVENCRVGRDVTIHAVVDDAYHHGGVVGRCNSGTISGCVSSATLTVANRLPGIDSYGGIVGHLDGKVSNCLSIDVSVPAVNRKGAIAGEVASNRSLTNNYYYNCTVGGATTNVGIGAEQGNTTPLHDFDGACSVHSLTLPTGVTATGESVTIGTDTYYASNTTVTLNVSTIGYSVTSYNDGTDHNITGNTFTMPAADVTVSATLTDLWDITSDKDGTTAEKAYTITSTAGLDLLATLVNGGNEFDGKYFKLGADITYTNTTDWDDATSTENNYTAIGGYVDGHWRYFCGTFDGQNHTVSGIRIYKDGYTYADDCQGLFGSTSGATIRNVILTDARITGEREVGGIAGFIVSNGNGGIVENCRVGSDVCIHAVVDYAYSHGGVVGRCNGGTISGCVSSATLTVAKGLTGIDEYGGIVGYLNGKVSDCLSIDVSVPAVDMNGAIAGIVDTYRIPINNYYYNCTVGGATTNVGIGGDNDNGTPHDRDGAVQVDAVLSETETVPSSLSGTVVFRREFTGGKASTICLPFALTDIEGGKAYEFVDVTYDAVDGWVATMSEVTTTEANKPYLFLPEGSGSVPVLFHGTAGYDVSGGLATTSGDWTFTGTYTNLTYGTEPMTGHIYGFASKSKTVDGHDVEAGQFVHAKDGASVPPMRCYLTYKNGAQRAPMRASALGATGTDTDVPSRITVRLVSASATVTAVGTLDTVTGEMDINTWYDMNGRLLETEPTAPGLYIHNGKTIMIMK